MQKNYQIKKNELNTYLQTDLVNGLTQEEVKRKLLEEGYNQLDEPKKRSIILKFFDQITDFMILVLIGASILSFITGDLAEGFLIIGIVIINAILGLAQEAKAEKALESIKELSSPQAKVRRDGKDQLINVKECVKGDLVLLDAGDYVPADVRIIESINLKCDESALTGEAVPVDKTDEDIDEDDLPLGDRFNMGYMGTVVTYGRGKAVIMDTGMHTELGHIASMLTETKDEQTPLQKSMASLGKILALIALGITVFIFIITIVEAYLIDGGASLDVWKEAFLTAIALAVAAIPEGLPAIITIVLALGMQNLVKKNAIIRTLPAVETLGSTAIICSDKTGTLTQNLMTVKNVFLHGKMIDINDKTESSKALENLATYGVLCNDTKLNKENDQLIKIGDPTEIALIDLAITLNHTPLDIHQAYPRHHELPFDSERKMMTTVHKVDGKTVAIIKGAPDVIFGRTAAIDQGSIDDLSLYVDANKAMAEKALRILAVAYKVIEPTEKLRSLSFQELEHDVTLLGLVGMMDPARPEVKDSIALCNKAGIKTIMITGDHKATAVAIALELGILHEDELAITGYDLDQMDDEAFFQALDKIRVYARVSPENKVRIVDAWKKKGEVVAMTGDGVNDAPSLKKADIGIAMGITGTEVAKGASDMILTDDNFATIVNAVSEGRAIFANIKKAILYLLSCNIGEILTIFLGTTIGILIFSTRVTTLTAVQILWINLVTDSIMAIALGLEPKEKNIMDEKPRDTKKSIFSDGFGSRIIKRGIMLGLLAFSSYILGWFLSSGASREIHAQTITFMVLAMAQLVHSFNVRSETQSMFKMQVNPFMIGAFVLSMSLQLLVIFLPFTRNLFGLIFPTMIEWIIIIVIVFVPVGIVEVQKWIKRHRRL
ncbi:MAG: cation-translocating P-type ATPase [Acholeplasma sp.]|jgi:Ca2+-transporting ATPase|nr:MAG: cation-translocating P-type ATPase [Acholeplasma sp.]